MINADPVPWSTRATSTAIATGAIAVLVALVDQGTGPALIMLAVVVAVQQIESHLLQPLLLGHAVSLHPVAVLLSVATGSLAAGVVGALLAVPFVTTLNTASLYLRGRDKFPQLGQDPDGLTRWLTQLRELVPATQVEHGGVERRDERHRQQGTDDSGSQRAGGDGEQH